MSVFKIVLLGFLYSFHLVLGSKCPQDTISKLVVCYYEGKVPLTNFNICNCTHVVFTNAIKRTENNSISATEGTIKYLEIIKEKKENLSAIFTLETKQDESSKILKSKNKTEQLINGIVEFLQKSHFDGVELHLKFRSDDGVPKESYSSFVKNLTKTLSSRHRRVKRDGYDVFEKVQDDITTIAYTTQTPKNSTSKTQSIKRRNRKSKENSRKTREKKVDDENDADYLTLEEAINTEFHGENSEKQNTLKDLEEDLFAEKKFLVFVRLSIKPEIIAKKYDLKVLSRYADILTVPTHHIANSNEDHLTYHPSRLMGLSDIQNTDSILDFLTGMGALKSKMVITLPASVLKFQLTDENKNTPRSPSGSQPRVIDQSQLCALFSKSNWTIERDDDLTAPYAFSGKTWLAFEDGISVNIKGKYILLRDLAGGAVYPIDSDVNDNLCNNLTGSGGYLTGVLHKNFESLERKPRALVLESLQDEIHETSSINIEAGIKLSEYRIVRVVDHSGAVHVIRKNTKTQFECSRQGYFSHPLGCNKFYRCVKFDQYSDEFTVFEYNCPVGLAFDERWEVCVWPGSLPHGAPCTGSSEIAPVPRSHYQCPNQEGYYADPENCRWFFACMDHARDGITPLTAYEFRCPFGLVFSEQRLACDWPWMVGSCGNRGAAGYLNLHSAGSFEGVHTATFINGGNLEASFGQYGNTDEETSFIGFGKKFGSILKGTNTYDAQGSYQGAQSAGFGYIASQFDDNNNRASFAAFPDYEISGGRILNKGGVVLNENIVGISNAAGGGGGGGAAEIYRGGLAGASRSLGKKAGYFHQEIVQSGGGEQGITNANFQKLETSKGNILDVTRQISIHQSSVPTPKPFSVSIPAVQINSEYSGHSEVKSTTPQTLLLEKTLLTEKDTKLPNVNQYFNSNEFTISQPAVPVGIPVVTPATNAVSEVATEGFGSSQVRADISLSTSSGHFSSTPRTESHKFGQTNLKQNQFSGRISVNQGEVTLGVPAVTSTQSFDYEAGNYGSKIRTEPVPSFLPQVTSKTGIHTFEYTASGLPTGQPFVSTESPFVNFPTQTQNTKQNLAGKVIESSAILSKSPQVDTSIITNIFERQNLDSENVAVGQSGIHYKAPLVTLTPSISTSEAKTEFESGRLPFATSGPALGSFVHSSIDEKVANELGFKKPQSSYAVSTVTPKSDSQSVLKKDFNEYFERVKLFSNKIPVGPPKPDFQGPSQAELNFNGVAGKSEVVSVVTPQPDLNVVKYYGEQTGGVSVTPVTSFESPKVTATIKNGFGQSGIAEVSNDFSKTSYNVPIIDTQSSVNSFGQTSSLLQKGILQEKTSYTVPAITSEIKTDAIVQTGGVSQVFVQPASVLNFSQVVVPVQPVQPIFGQRYSYSSFKQSENQLGSIQPFGLVNSTPKPKTVFAQKVDQPNTLTEVTIEQQPIVSVGTISSTSVDQTVSTPKPLLSSQDIFSHGPPAQNFNIKTSYIQPQTLAVSTTAPALSTISTNVVEELSRSPDVNIIYKSPQTHKQQERVNIESFSSGHQQTVFGIPFTGQKSNFKQEIKSFTPIAQVTTSSPFTYDQGIFSNSDANSAFYGKSNAYLPPVTSKPKIFASVIQQNSQIPFGQFETTEKNQILIQQEQQVPLINQQFEFLKTKPLAEGKRTEFVQQLPFQVNSALPDYTHQVKNEQSSVPAVTTTNPLTAREELVGLEISKSIEINPSQFFESTDGQSPKLPAQSIQIQPQNIHLVSQKTFSNKQVIQPFYPQKEKGDTQINYPENRHQGQFVLQQQINAVTPNVEISEQKPYLPPAVTSKPHLSSVRFSTAKSVTVEQPAVYSEGSANVAPALPIFEASRIPFTGQKETTSFGTKTDGRQLPTAFIKSTSKSAFVDQFDIRQPEGLVSSKVNLLLPIPTEAPQFKADESSLQTQNNFDSQKINAFGAITGHSKVQPTLKPIVNGFQTLGYSSFQSQRAQNFTSEINPSVGSGVRYAINPNIEIPEPPREYILAQNAYTTAVPEFATPVIQFSSKSAESENAFKGSTYLPPQESSRRKSTKTTIISAGNVNGEDFRHDNVQQAYAEPLGIFGEVINGKNEKFVTKLIKGNGEGDIAINREGSSTIRYEISSVTPRPRGRGRQYHGGITSGIQATNKYEEYEINEEKNSQKSLETENGYEGEGDISKTTLDLKNLNLDKNKKTVIVVSQVSDANPVLIGKLAGQCSCQSNMLEIRSKGKKSKNSLKRKNSQKQRPQAIVANEYLPPFESNQANIGTGESPQGVTPSYETVQVDGIKPFGQGISYTTEQSLVSSSTTARPELLSSTILSSLGPDGVISITPKAVFVEGITKNKKKQFRGRTRYLPPSSLPLEDVTAPLLSSVPASEIASTFDYSALSGDESRTQNEIEKGIPKVAAGAAFDRYGPGGWRSFDETLQGSVDCKRPGLFRHPKYCNKFYACNYDPRKERYTLHVFNCPIHLTYDSSISACNWPVRGPACADDNLLV